MCPITRVSSGSYFQFSSVAQSCPTLCEPMDCSTPGFPVHHQLPNSFPSSWWCHPTILSSVVPFSSNLQSFPASGSFLVSQFFTSGDPSPRLSGMLVTSASVLPKNIQDWFPLGWTGSIFLLSKGLSRVSSNTTVQNYQFLVLRILYSPILTSIHDYWKKKNKKQLLLDRFCWQSKVSDF